MRKERKGKRERGNGRKVEMVGRDKKKKRGKLGKKTGKKRKKRETRAEEGKDIKVA